MRTTVVGILLSGYIVCIAFLNCICYLISSFYERKFREYSPKAGFLFAGISSIIIALSIVIFNTPHWGLALGQIGLLIASSIAMAINVISLYYRMKRIRK